MIWPILLLGLLLRLISLNQSLWLDEAINIIAAKQYSFFDLITKYAVADFHPPGYLIFIWFWGRIGGFWEIWMRIPSVVFGILTIWIVYLIGKKLYSKTVGLISAFLLATNPLHIYYSQEARMYVLAALAVAINFYFLIKLLKEEKVGLAILVLSNLFVLCSDYVAILIFPAQLIYLLIYRENKVIVFWFKGILIALILSIWWLPVFLSQLHTGSVASANLPIWKSVVGGFDIKSLALTPVKFIIGRISISDKLVYFLTLIPICLFTFFLIIKGILDIKGRFRGLIIVWLLLPIIIATLISFIIPVYSYFRLIFVLPPYVILIALGIISYQNKLRYLLLGVVLVIQIISSSVYLLNVNFQREDWRGLVRYLASVAGKSPVYFESSGTLPPFDYYTNGYLNAKGALKNFPARSESDLIDLESVPLNVKEIFLVNYLVEISDPKQLVSKKLDELGYKLSETKDFHGVGFVYHYVK